MLLLVGLAVAELVLAQRLHGGYLDLRARPFSGEHGLQRLDQPSVVLERFVGAGPGIRYRWDPEGGVLRFGRSLGVIRGAHAYAVGTVDFSSDRPVVRWHPILLSLPPSVALVATVVIGGAVLEGAWPMLVALPVVWGGAVVLDAILWSNGRETLERYLLPLLAESLEAHVQSHKA